MGEEVIYDPAGTGIRPLQILPLPDSKEMIVVGRQGTAILADPNLRFSLVNVAAHSVRELGGVPGAQGRVAWKAPGKTISFNRTVNDLTNLWEYNLSDERLTQETLGPGPDYSPMPDPGGKGTYFINGKQTGALTVYQARTKKTADVVPADATQPVLSDDGRRVAYVLLAGSGRQELWASDVDGSNRIKLASSGTLLTLAWSHDSSRYAFSEVTDKGAKLFTIRADGSGLRQIPWSGAFVGEASWSPDDKFLYLSGYEKEPAKVATWKASADGSTMEMFAEGCGYLTDISPDGKFLLEWGGSSEGEKIGIYELSTAEKRCKVLLPGIAAFVAHFSPDAKSFTYPVATRGEMTIYRQPWLEGELKGPTKVAVKLTFAFRQDYSGNAYDYSKDLSTFVYARPGGQADLYLLSQK